MSDFLPQEVIRRKRDGLALDDEAIQRFVAGIADGSISEGQVAAFAMAVFFRGMEFTEQATLTRAMTGSGRILDWSGMTLRGPVVDKHSTGGVGDKVSLMLAPIVAACGAHVPMISGRGLGHTGGTLDKLESIPGYNATPDLETFMKITADIGCSIIGQTGDLAPADRRFYAIRDVTATVESLPLITGSILSKKLAAGLDALVMDVKFGSGAFMRELDDARALARNITDVATAAGLPTVSLLTDMNEVLGSTAGNAVEVLETIGFLCGEERDPRLEACTLDLAAHMLALSGISESVEKGRTAASMALEKGHAAELFGRMVTAHGGPADLLNRSADYLPTAGVVRDVTPGESGIVGTIDARSVGLAVISLGGGRTRADQDIDPAVGLTHIAGVGATVGPDAPLARIHARSEEDADVAARMLREAFTVSADAPAPQPVVREIVEAGGTGS